MLGDGRGGRKRDGGLQGRMETPRPLYASALTLERQDKPGPISGAGPPGAGGDKAGGECYDAAEILKIMGRRWRRCRNATMRVRSVSVKRTSRSYLKLSEVNKVEQQMDNAAHSKQRHRAERTSRFRVQKMKMMIMRGKRRRRTGRLRRMKKEEEEKKGKGEGEEGKKEEEVKE